jgi:tetratricopeptide (TPR) repeat protein
LARTASPTTLVTPIALSAVDCGRICFDTHKPGVGVAVSWLAEYFEEQVAKRSLGVVVLRSPAGWGKTVEVAELYEELAARQPLPRFWPARFEPERTGASFENVRGDPKPPAHSPVRRKRIYPAPFRVPAGARMPFLWWGLRGELGEDGRPRFRGLDLDGQLTEIMQPLAEAIAADERLWRDRAVTVLKAAVSTTAVSLLPVGQTVRTIKELTDIAGELLELVPQLYGQARGNRARTEKALRAHGGSTLRTDGAAQARAGAEHAGSILAAVSHVLPTVVAVEDAQYLDDHTIAMLRAWVRSELPVGLLVLTVATDRPGPRGEWQTWQDELQRSDLLDVDNLEPLSDEVLQEIALDRLAADLPGYTVALDAVAEVAVRAGGNPLALHVLLDQPVVVTALSSGDREGVRAAAALVPTIDSGLYMTFERFDSLTRCGLAILSLLGQVTLSSWYEAALRVSLDSVTDRAAALTAVTESGWCEHSDDGVIRFVDATGYRIAGHAAAEFLDERRRDAVIHCLAALVQAAYAGPDWADVPTLAKQEAIHTLLTCDSSAPADRASALMLELHDIYLRTGQGQRRRHLLYLMQRQLALVTRTVADQLVVTLGAGLLDLGDTDSALRVLRKHYERLAEELGPENRETLVALHNLAAALRTAGQLQAAVTVYHELLGHRLKVLPAHHEHIRDTRRDLAAVLTEQGRDADARDQLQALHEDNVATIGSDHRLAISDEIQLARMISSAGAPKEAISLLNPLLMRASKILPRYDFLLCLAANTLAGAHRAAGHLEYQRRFHQYVLDIQLLSLGAEHPDTLTTRGHLVSWRGRAGDPAGAAAECEQILADMVRVHGPDHTITLAARSNLAYWHGQTGDLVRAATETERLLDDMVRVLGPDHPTTLNTRNNVAHWRGKTGTPAGAVVVEYERLLDDMVRVHGPDHPETLLTHHNLAYWRGNAGDLVGGIAELERLLADRVRVLGPDHPDTLTTRSNLASCRANAGDLVGGIAELERLLADRVRVLGPDHPDTLDARSNLASCRANAGDLVRGIAELERLLADRVRVLGPDHPATLTTRDHLASCRTSGSPPNG